MSFALHTLKRHVIALAVGAGLALASHLALAAPTGSFIVDGQVNNPHTYSINDAQQLANLPTVTESNLAVAGSYTGVSMYSLLGASGIKTDPTQTKNSFTSQIVVATGADGYRVVYSGGELDPGFGGNTAKPMLVANQLNGGAIGNNGAYRTIAPEDVKGGRYVSNLTALTVYNTQTKTGAGGYSDHFTVSGEVVTPMTIFANSVGGDGSFAGLTAITENVTYTSAGTPVNKTFNGISLWNFLNAVTGIAADPLQAKNHLGQYVLATGSDGYKAVFAIGELDPAFGGAAANSDSQYLIAYTGTGTGFQIVVPGDVKGGRYVSNLVSLQILSVPEPESLALLLPALGLLALSRRRASVALPA